MEIKAVVADWMNQNEKCWIRHFTNEMRKVFRKLGVAQTPLLSLRVNDVGVAYLIVRRAEAVLVTPEDQVAEDAALERIAKNRERMRKAMKEIEEYCQKTGKTSVEGMAEQLHPLLEKARQVENEIIAGLFPVAPGLAAPRSAPAPPGRPAAFRAHNHASEQ